MAGETTAHPFGNLEHARLISEQSGRPVQEYLNGQSLEELEVEEALRRAATDNRFYTIESFKAAKPEQAASIEAAVRQRQAADKGPEVI